MAGRETPLMQQHAAAKNAYPDCIIFFRLGDFYEMFGEDAVVASRALELTLTSRNKGKPDEVPMAGVPHHSAHGYIARLLEQGFKVAICEQMADPSTVKGIVPREVVRVITPGTWTETDQLNQSQNNWLCAVARGKKGLGIALLDLSTAEILGAEVADLASILAELGRARPREILLCDAWEELSESESLQAVLGGASLRQVEPLSEEAQAEFLKRLDAPPPEPAVQRAFAQVLDYACSCFRGKMPPIWRVGVWNASGVLGLDTATQRHLELVESTVGDKKATLLAILDRTQTAGGARLLRRRLLSPLTDPQEIGHRLDQVECLTKQSLVRSKLRELLGEVTDLERISVRATLGEANPRDLGSLRRGLLAAREVVTLLQSLKSKKERAILGVDREIDCVDELSAHLSRALVERPPAQAKEGAIFQTGYDAELDRLQELCLRGTEAISAFEGRLREQVGIPQLRVRFTRVFGWYVEVTRSQASKVPEYFRRKQTVANAERYSLPELDDLAEQIASAEVRFRDRELSLLSELFSEVVELAPRIHGLAALLSLLDVASCLAEVAVDYDYCRPEVDAGAELTIEEGRHPVVERLVASSRFVPNDVQLEIQKTHLWLISGPNMAGKSTFLRQVALNVIMAQMGSFVPAKRARVGVVDRVLSRVGASDNLAGGESTFMVEMRETSHILKTATSRSLVIIDEVGRGTSTFDGLAIAWAVAEYLDQQIGCRALFATHYHELTALEDSSEGCENYSVSAREEGNDVIFLHRVARGAASRSFGVHVAQLAGLPEPVLARARTLLRSLEAKNRAAEPRGAQGSFAFSKEEASPASSHGKLGEELLENLQELQLDRLTGLEALGLLAAWQKKLSANRSIQ